MKLLIIISALAIMTDAGKRRGGLKRGGKKTPGERQIRRAFGLALPWADLHLATHRHYTEERADRGKTKWSYKFDNRREGALKTYFEGIKRIKDKCDDPDNCTELETCSGQKRGGVRELTRGKPGVELARPYLEWLKKVMQKVSTRLFSPIECKYPDKRQEFMATKFNETIEKVWGWYSKCRQFKPPCPDYCSVKKKNGGERCDDL